MTLPRSDVPWETPSHRDLLSTWSQLCDATEMADPTILVVPEAPGLAACAFYPTEDHSVAECIDDVVRTLITDRMVDNPWPWAALVSPAFMKTMSPEEWDQEDLHRGDLQRHYAEGDMDVREVVCVTMVDIADDASSRTFMQPLLEEIGDEAHEVEGPVVNALRRAIMCSILND